MIYTVIGIDGIVQRKTLKADRRLILFPFLFRFCQQELLSIILIHLLSIWVFKFLSLFFFFFFFCKIWFLTSFLTLFFVFSLVLSGTGPETLAYKFIFFKFPLQSQLLGCDMMVSCYSDSLCVCVNRDFVRVAKRIRILPVKSNSRKGRGEAQLADFWHFLVGIGKKVKKLHNSKTKN